MFGSSSAPRVNLCTTAYLLSAVTAATSESLTRYDQLARMKRNMPYTTRANVESPGGDTGGMRKRILQSEPAPVAQGAKSNEGWLDIERIATVEVTSEHPDFPIDNALGPVKGEGWRAAEPGEQLIRLVFDNPVSLRTIELGFREAGSERTQEFILRCSRAGRERLEDLVRQQWNFCPGGSTEEIERYTVDLEAVSALELAIRPDLHRSFEIVGAYWFSGGLGLCRALPRVITVV
jgi:hypothetical protein